MWSGFGVLSPGAAPKPPNAAPTISPVTLVFEIPGDETSNAAPTISDVTFVYTVPIGSASSNAAPTISDVTVVYPVPAGSGLNNAAPTISQVALVFEVPAERPPNLIPTAADTTIIYTVPVGAAPPNTAPTSANVTLIYTVPMGMAQSAPAEMQSNLPAAPVYSRALSGTTGTTTGLQLTLDDIPAGLADAALVLTLVTYDEAGETGDILNTATFDDADLGTPLQAGDGDGRNAVFAWVLANPNDTGAALTRHIDMQLVGHRGWHLRADIFEHVDQATLIAPSPQDIFTQVGSTTSLSRTLSTPSQNGALAYHIHSYDRGGLAPTITGSVTTLGSGNSGNSPSSDVSYAIGYEANVAIGATSSMTTSVASGEGRAAIAFYLEPQR